MDARKSLGLSVYVETASGRRVLFLLRSSVPVDRADDRVKCTGVAVNGFMAIFFSIRLRCDPHGHFV